MKTSLCLVALAIMFTAGSASAGDAKAIFDTNCAKCHGADGKGGTKMGQKAGCKDFTDAAYQATLTNDKMASAIKNGVKEGDKSKMKGFPELAADTNALVAYIRAFKK